jgi:hypothetical protein
VSKNVGAEVDDWLPIEADHFSPDFRAATELSATVGELHWRAEKHSGSGHTEVVLLDDATELARINGFDLSRANWTEGSAQGQPGVRGSIGSTPFVLHQPDSRTDGRIKSMAITLGDRELELSANGRLSESDDLWALLSGKFAYVATHADRDVMLLSVLLRVVNVQALVTFEKTAMPEFLARGVVKALEFIYPGYLK